MVKHLRIIIEITKNVVRTSWSCCFRCIIVFLLWYFEFCGLTESCWLESISLLCSCCRDIVEIFSDCFVVILKFFSLCIFYFMFWGCLRQQFWRTIIKLVRSWIIWEYVCKNRYYMNEDITMRNIALYKFKLILKP